LETVVLKIFNPVPSPHTSMVVLTRGRSATIGRSAKRDIALPNRYISRHHMTIGWPEQGPITIEDLSSLNGSRLNGEKILGITECRVGDLIQLSNVSIEILSGDTAVVPAPIIPGNAVDGLLFDSANGSGARGIERTAVRYDLRAESRSNTLREGAVQIPRAQSHHSILRRAAVALSAGFLLIALL